MVRGSREPKRSIGTYSPSPGLVRLVGRKSPVDIVHIVHVAGPAPPHVRHTLEPRLMVGLRLAVDPRNGVVRRAFARRSPCQ